MVFSDRIQVDLKLFSLLFTFFKNVGRDLSLRLTHINFPRFVQFGCIFLGNEIVKKLSCITIHVWPNWNNFV